MEQSKKSKTVLLIDDDSDLREMLAEIIVSEGYVCLSAENGAVGLAMAQNNPVSVIITDVRMPQMDGLDLLKQVKASSVPVIIITGEAGDLDLNSATTLGAADFLHKPFKKEDLLNSLELVLFKKIDANDDDPQNLDTEYCRVHIDDFLSGTKVGQDLYLRLSQTKYLRVAKAEAPLLPERVNSYKQKGLQYFYIKKDEFAKYVGFNLKVAQSLKTGAVKIKKSDKLRLVRQASDVYMENIFVNGIDKEQFSYGKSLAESALQMTVEADSLFELLDMLRSQSDVTYSHCLAVSVYASLVAKAAGWTSASTLFKISMAGLLHDVGKKEIAKSILLKSRLEMTPEDVKLYETHPTRGRDILFHVPSTPEEVVMTVYQHHEKMNGSGYPNQTQRGKIHPFARIIGLVDEFCHLVLKGPYGQGMEPGAAMTLIYPTKALEYDGFFIKALMQILQVPVPEKLRNVAIANDVREGK